MNYELRKDKIKSFTDLKAWQEAHKLVLAIYKITKNFPREELFGLVNQMRRAAVSITSGIAEGFSRQSYKEKAHFYSIAQGSNTELQNQLLVAKDVGYLDSPDFQKTAEQSVTVHKLLNGLIKKSKTLILFFILYSLFFILAPTAQAASLYFSPSSGSYAIGQTFPVTVYVSSADQAMNAASGVISFPSDKLSVEALSKTGSIFSLWVQEPSFSNSAGAVNFEGIVLNPGFTGATGKIITINFKAKAAGTALLNFSSGSVLANDGKGTNILTGLGSAVFGVNLAPSGPQAPETTTPSVVAGAPLAPVISSFTHPDPGKWYNTNTVKFSWPAPNDVIAVRLLYDKNPTSQPRIVYEPPIFEKEVQDLKDGIYYFHAQFKNKNGWGAIAHFRFQIDTQPPEPFTIKFVDGRETDNPRPTVLFETDDSPSGIENYKIKVGEGDFFSAPVALLKGNPYTLPSQAPGKYIILVQAFDKAGNYAVATEEFVIKPIAAPIISEYPEELTEGEILKIKGRTSPEAIVVIFFKSDLGKILFREIKADNQGDFTLIWQDQLKSGVYTFWAEATDSRGAKSEKSSIFTLVVKERAFVKIGSLVINYALAIISLLVVGFALFFLGWYLWYRFLLFKKRKRKQIKEIKEAEQAVYSAFNLLRKSVREHLKLLEKTKNRREFTEAEDKIAKQLREDLDAAEKFVEKEIEDVEKEIK